MSEGTDVDAFFVAHFQSMCRLAGLLVGDPALAEEIAMDAFVVVCGGWRRIEDMDNREAYLRRVVVNIANSRLRRRFAERRANARAGAARADEVKAWDPSVAEDSRAVFSAVAGLPPRQRACVALHYYEQLSIAETAAVLRCSPGTVKSQLAKARSSLVGVLG